jgi:hypothetical protein
MKTTKHAELRMNKRGVHLKLVDYAEFFLPSFYENQCNKIFLSKKMAKAEAKKIRKFAEIIEKHAGTELLIDQIGDNLITVYRR